MVSKTEACVARPAPSVSHPLVIQSDDEGNGKALLTVPFTMVLRNVRAYTTDPAGLRVCRMGLIPAGSYGSRFWSPIDESTEVLPPLHHLVASDERPDAGCALSGLRLEGGRKYDVVIQPLEGLAPFTVELTFFAEPEC